MTDLLGLVLVLGMIVIMAARTVPVVGAAFEGEVQLELPLPFVFRLLDQRTNILAVLAVLVLGSGVVGERWISHELFLFALVAILGIASLPRRYRFTTKGVSPNRATFRAWNEFQAWQISGNVIKLQGSGRISSLKLYVGQSSRDGVRQLLQRHVPGGTAQPHPAARGARRGVPKLARMKGGTR